MFWWKEADNKQTSQIVYSKMINAKEKNTAEEGSRWEVAILASVVAGSGGTSPQRCRLNDHLKDMRSVLCFYTHSTCNSALLDRVPCATRWPPTLYSEPCRCPDFDLCPPGHLSGAYKVLPLPH